MKTRNSQKGFVMILFVFLLPVVLALGFAMAAVCLMIRDRRTVLNTCRADLLEGLTRAAEPMQKLLALNPQALSLKMQYARAKIAYESALASGHPIPIAIAAARLHMVHMQRVALNQEQQLLYHEARAFIVTAQHKAYGEFRKRPLFLKLDPELFLESRPALHPQSPDLAPQWAKNDGFSDAQTLQQSWTWSYKIQGSAARFLKSQLQRRETCAATLDDQNLPWRARLQSPAGRDKFLSSL